MECENVKAFQNATQFHPVNRRTGILPVSIFFASKPFKVHEFNARIVSANSLPEERRGGGVTNSHASKFASSISIRKPILATTLDNGPVTRAESPPMLKPGLKARVVTR
jgi:hypothetical protein